MTANLLRDDESPPCVAPVERPQLHRVFGALSFPGGPVDTTSFVESHNGPTPSTKLSHEQLVEMAKDALVRIASDDSADPKRSARFAFDCLRDALERWP